MLVAFALVACVAGDGPVPDLDSLTKVMAGLHADLKDAEFVYEGGKVDLTDDAPNRVPTDTFQGRFAFRPDDSIHIDPYIRHSNSKQPIERRIACLTRDGEHAERTVRPDLPQPERIRRRKGVIASMQSDLTPLHLLLAPDLLDLLNNVGGRRTSNDFQYECHGWEKIDNHNCLNISLSTATKFRGKAAEQYVWWIDMDRGGTPIRYDLIRQGHLWARAEGIELAQFSIDGGRAVWLPIRGVFHTYLNGKMVDGMFVPESRPVFEETLLVVDGTVKINQNLPDKRFTLDWKQNGGGDQSGMAKSELDQRLRRPRAKTPQAEVDRALEVADRQRVHLEASAPSREWASSTMIGASCLGAFGVLLISTPWIARRWRA